MFFGNMSMSLRAIFLVVQPAEFFLNDLLTYLSSCDHESKGLLNKFWIDLLLWSSDGSNFYAAGRVAAN